jgi:hypothetical protein
MTLITDPDDPRLGEIEPSGMQKAYLVLSEAERAKGFVRPLRRSYIHLKCGGETHMGLALCETYARDPSFYGGTFCSVCGDHFHLFETRPNGETVHNFLWAEDNEPVGS